MFYGIFFGSFTTIDPKTAARCIAIMNRPDLYLIKSMEFMVDRCDLAKRETYATAEKLGQELLSPCPSAAAVVKGR